MPMCVSRETDSMACVCRIELVHPLRRLGRPTGSWDRLEAESWERGAVGRGTLLWKKEKVVSQMKFKDHLLGNFALLRGDLAFI